MHFEALGDNNEYIQERSVAVSRLIRGAEIMSVSAEEDLVGGIRRGVRGNSVGKIYGNSTEYTQYPITKLSPPTTAAGKPASATGRTSTTQEPKGSQVTQECPKISQGQSENGQAEERNSCT